MRKQANRWLKSFRKSRRKIMHNAQYDVGWARRMGFTVNGKIIDTMVIASLLDENRFSYTLNSCRLTIWAKLNPKSN